jgi:hypothetical protein
MATTHMKSLLMRSGSDTLSFPTKILLKKTKPKKKLKFCPGPP